MKKTFEYKGVKLVVKTNFLSNGQAFFQSVDMDEVLKEAVKTVDLETYSPEVVATEVFSYLQNNRIAPVAVIVGNVEHNGEKITDVGSFRKS